jgi:DEAD/DEAH box helicase domain-containing protein
MSKIYHEVIFDLETQKFFDETGTSDPADLGVSVVSLYSRKFDSEQGEITGEMLSFWENDFEHLWKYFREADRIIGFNSLSFDVQALKPYAPPDFAKLPHFDIIDHVRTAFGHRVSLNKIAKDTLNDAKTDSGANAVMYWQKHDPESLAKLQSYCEADVRITRDVYDYGYKNKTLKFTDHWNTPRIISVDFSYPAENISSAQPALF